MSASVRAGGGEGRERERARSSEGGGTRLSSRPAPTQINFRDAEVPHTVYTHCVDPTRTRLFVGGGPLPFGLQGAYAAVW